MSKWLPTDMNPSVIASKSHARLTRKTIRPTVAVIAIVCVGALTERRRGYGASLSERAAYDPGRCIRRPKTCSTIIMRPGEFCPILRGDIGSWSLSQCWNNVAIVKMEACRCWWCMQNRRSYGV
jgi:hypothetical protein